MPTHSLTPPSARGAAGFLGLALVCVALSAAAADKTYTVKRNDTLTDLAHKNGLTVGELAARNGLKKIVFVNAHGGNDHLIHYFAQIQLAAPRDYIVYVASPEFSEEDDAMIKSQWETTVDGHAGEKETSAILAIREDLVKKEEAPAEGQA